MIPTLQVTSHTDLELYGFDVNYVPAISKYSITCISSMKKTVVVGLTPKQCTFCVCSDDIHIVSDISYKIRSHLVYVLRINVNISEDSDRTYSKEAHSLYFLMIPACYSGDVLFIFAVLKILSTQV